MLTNCKEWVLAGFQDWANTFFLTSFASQSCAYISSSIISTFARLTPSYFWTYFKIDCASAKLTQIIVKIEWIVESVKLKTILSNFDFIRSSTMDFFSWEHWTSGWHGRAPETFLRSSIGCRKNARDSIIMPVLLLTVFAETLNSYAISGIFLSAFFKSAPIIIQSICFGLRLHLGSFTFQCVNILALLIEVMIHLSWEVVQ